MPPSPRGRSLALTLFPFALVSAGAVCLCLGFRLQPASLGPFGLAGGAAEVLLTGLLLLGLFRRAAAANGGGEALRWTLLLGAGLVLTLPYLRPERVGAGDAQDYAQSLADFIVQARQGVFPVLVGQSRFAYNGAFNPVRTAPYFEYVGGALHLLAFGRLGAFALQNLEIILSLVAAGFSCYLCLGRLAPRRGWLCLALTLLYLTSPGILALVYGGDMVPSWLTLPYLPAAFYLLVRIAGAGATRRRLLGLATVMAAIWWAHAPIAMWLSFAAAPVVAAGLLRAASRREAALLAAGSLGAFALLAAYEFVSVAELRLPAIPGKAAAFSDGTVLRLLSLSWRGFLRPVSADGAHLLSDLQLSPGLWAGLAFAGLGWRRGGWGLRVLLLVALGYLALIVPLPAVAGRIWAVLPVWIGQITDLWPVQRFFPILSALVPFGALLAWLSFPETLRRRAAWTLAWFLVAACGWSALEADKFLERGYRVSLPPDLSHKAISAGNAVLSPYSYNMLGPLPRSYTAAPVTPEMQLSLLDPGTLASVATDASSVRRLADAPAWTGGFVATARGLVVRPQFAVQPGWGYLLELEFDGPAVPGTLVLTGERLWRAFPVPADTINFSAPLQGAAEPLEIRFQPSVPAAAPARLGRVRIRGYRRESLPLRVVSLTPYRVQADLPAGGWLQTTLIFIPGYRATVNGTPAEVVRSPDGLVMVRVAAGKSALELAYVGSALLRGSFWLSLAAWLGLPALWAFGRLARLRRRPPVVSPPPRHPASWAAELHPSPPPASRDGPLPGGRREALQSRLP